MYVYTHTPLHLFVFLLIFISLLMPLYLFRSTTVKTINCEINDPYDH